MMSATDDAFALEIIRGRPTLAGAACLWYKNVFQA
jgi:hypothetical protein